MVGLILINIMLFVLGYLVGLVTMSVLACKSKEEAVNEAFKLGYEMRNVESNTIDVTELKQL